MRSRSLVWIGLLGLVVASSALAQSNTPRAETWVTNGPIRAIATTPTTVYIGGQFTEVGPVGGPMQTRNRIAAIDVVTGEATAWDPNSNNYVSALAVSADGTTVYAGGDYENIGGQARNAIAALDAVTGQATAWDPDGGMSGVVYALKLSPDGTTVYAGGTFSNIGGEARSRIAALDSGTGFATAWDPSADATLDVLALSADGRTVYAGGSFTNIGGETRSCIAALDAGTGLATPWNPNANDAVRRFAVTGTTVYAGGHFTTIGGQGRNYIAALDVGTGLATDWNPSANLTVLGLAVSADETMVYAGGGFTSIGGQSRNRIAALDVETSNASSWNPNANNSIYAFAVLGSRLYAGGPFTTIGGQSRGCFAEFPLTPDAPSNPGATEIGPDTITWTWQDNANNETGFKVYDEPGAGPPVSLRTTPTPDTESYRHNGLSANTQYAFQVRATNSFGDSALTANYTAWTLAATPAAPVVGNTGVDTVDLIIGAGDGNPADTLYSIMVDPPAGGYSCVQADGSVAMNPVYQTAAAWGVVTVTGLEQGTQFFFFVTAKNGAGVETSPGDSGIVSLQAQLPVTGLTGWTAILLALGAGAVLCLRREADTQPTS